MKRETVDILGVNIDNIDMETAGKKALSFLEAETQKVIITPNPEFILFAQEDASYQAILNACDLVVPDGIGIILGAKLLETPLKERVPGIELIENIMKYFPPHKSVFLLGAKGDITDKVARKMTATYKNLCIAGTHHGYFTGEETPDIIRKINDSKADMLLVGLGPPRQEKWIFEHKDALQVKVFMAVGGSFDVLSGTLKRAPDIFIRFHLEWLYRLIQEPSRIKRQIFIPKYLLAILRERKNRKKYTIL